jgi:hypothetical protein
MRKNTKPKRRKRKPGPREERLIIRGDVQAALTKLLKQKPE